MYRHNIVLCLFIISVAILISPGSSVGQDSVEAFFHEWVAMSEDKFVDAECVLLCTPKCCWTDEDISNYLESSLEAAYVATALFRQENHRLPASAAELASAAILSIWPCNPFNCWEPMEIYLLEDGYRPGDMVMQIPPYEYWSGRLDPRPLSFELSICGPTTDFSPREEEIRLANFQWAVVPDSVAAQVGAFVETWQQAQEGWELKQRILAEDPPEEEE